MGAALEKPQEGTPVVVKLGTKSLKQALDKLARVVPSRSSSRVLGHVALTPTYGALVLAASDGFRLALAERELPEGIVVTLPKEAEEAEEAADTEDAQAAPEEPFAFVTPKRSLIELLRLLPTGGAPVELRHRRGRLVVVTEDVRYATALLEGVYPDYRRPIPDEFVAVAGVAVKPLREALRRVLVLADANHARVDLTFEEAKKAGCVSSARATTVAARRSWSSPPTRASPSPPSSAAVTSTTPSSRWTRRPGSSSRVP